MENKRGQSPFDPCMLLPYSQQEIDLLQEEFQLEFLDYQQLVAVVKLSDNSFFYLNPRKLADCSSERYVQRAKAISPFGNLRGYQQIGRNHALQLMQTIGQPFEWQPCGPEGCKIPMMRCVVPTSMTQYYSPPLRA